MTRRRPGDVRDAILDALTGRAEAWSVAEIQAAVQARLSGTVAPSSIRSYLLINEGRLFERVDRGRYRLKQI